jgi:hypothetical protein
MKPVSAQSFIKKSTATFERFPFAIIAAVIGAIYSILLVHSSFDSLLSDKNHYYYNILMSSYLGLLLFIALTVFCERISVSKSIKYLIQGAGLLIVIGYYFTLPDHFALISFTKFTLYSIGLHLLIAFVPYITKDEQRGFWQYNKTIFIRILTALLYTTVLFAGIAIALLSIETLFKINIDYKLYADLWILLSGIFNTWFFLAGFPADFEALETTDDYPKGLQIFTQFVLLPLITVYLLILYAYMIKIIVLWQWPVGYISYLVIAFSIAGILSLLLIHPIRNDEKNKWILTYSRFFYLAIFPLIILLALAIKRRISDYGITENRYFILVLAMWLIGMATYFLISRNKSIKVIPVSLCLIVFLSSFGPWSSFNVAIYSQQKHLVSLLEKNKMIVNGKIKPAHDTISSADRTEISSTISYLIDKHGYQTLQPYFSENLDSLMKPTLKTDYSFEQSAKIFSLMKISESNDYDESAKEEKTDDVETPTLTYTSNYDDGLPAAVTGYDYLISNYSMQYSEGEDSTTSYTLGNTDVTVAYSNTKKQLYIIASEDSLAFNISGLLISLKNRGESEDSLESEQEAADMTLQSANNKMAAKVIFKNISVKKDSILFDISNIEANILLKLK